MGTRGPKQTLTERDKQVLVDLYFARCMTGNQIKESCFGEQKRYAQTRLKQLRDRGYIQSFSFAGTRHDKTKSFDYVDGSTHVYSLTDIGLWEVESYLGKRILTDDSGVRSGNASNLSVNTHSVGRYLQAAEVYVRSKNKVRWLPRIVIRNRIDSSDWSVACMAGVERNSNIVLLFGCNKEPHLNTFKIISTNIKHASEFKRYKITKHILMCPDQETLGMAFKYYKEKQSSGELYVMTYKAAQEDLPFVFGDGEKVLLEELRNFYGRWCQVHQATGRNSANFFEMFEHKPNRFTYFADLSTGNIRMFEKVEFYNQRRAEEDAPFNNKLVRAVYALVRDYKQFEFVKGILDNHQHVRLILRDVPGRPIYGVTKTGEWVQVEKPVQRIGGEIT